MRRKSEEGRGGKKGEKGAGMGGEELEERNWKRGRDEERGERKWNGREESGGGKKGGEILTKFWFH